MDTSQANDLSRGQRVRWTTARWRICSGDGTAGVSLRLRRNPETLARALQFISRGTHVACFVQMEYSSQM